MSQTSSTVPNVSFHHSSIISYPPYGLDCFFDKSISSTFTAFTITYIVLLLPLCILVLYHGLQRWRQQRFSCKATTMSHSDAFTYHLVTVEIFNVFGNIFCFGGIYQNSVTLSLVWFYLTSFTWYGETLFHVLTCVERYLAVVHPITYLSLRKERGVRIRNISIGCIWLLCLGGTSMMNIKNVFIIVDFCLLITSVIIVSFCSLSALCVLIHSAPGEQGRNQVKVEQSKKRAFYTMVAILGGMMLRFAWNLVWTVMDLMNIGINQCLGSICEFWFNLPSSLVLPLLFLRRSGTSVWYKDNVK